MIFTLPGKREEMRCTAWGTNERKMSLISHASAVCFCIFCVPSFIRSAALLYSPWENVPGETRKRGRRRKKTNDTEDKIVSENDRLIASQGVREHGCKFDGKEWEINGESKYKPCSICSSSNVEYKTSKKYKKKECCRLRLPRNCLPLIPVRR